MPQKTNVDLTGIFQSVTQALEENQQTLDQADAYNQNHGSNMVQTFQTITGALEKKKGSSGSAALTYAAKTLEKNANSGSSRLYAQNLNRAAAEFKGKKIDAQGAMQLLQTLIGGPSGQSSSSGDLLGSLLGGMGGGQPTPQSSTSSGGDLLGSLLGGMGGEQPAAQSSTSSGGDLLGSLLGGMTGGNSSSNSQQAGLDMQDILSAGMAFMQAKQSGGSTVQALVQAFMAGSGMGNASHRQESTQVVIQSFLQALGSANAKR